uniref:Uncharacterized protein n=1 Tax=Candidatus Kentrum sp. TUN TaxID=2126343 RepID=A0A450ZLU8_9GAMM|nr:MAG: hypothetical protein BECKTUN1418F_GA0071002_10526 [Candidatus Kentron sp. TUN]VFK58379.1 MAG: hypothetical protein BECKTUN1418E_GA0071001_10497 [Candidatus Kentron sp. TUN]
MFETLDLAVLLGEVPLTSNNLDDHECEEGDSPNDSGCINARGRLDNAFKKFNENNNGELGKRRRNEIQDRLIAASVQRCNVYKIYLEQTDTLVNFFLGGLTTALGGAGAIVTGEGAARTLAGLAGISSGFRAEFRQAYLANLSVHIITEGIDTRRRQISEAPFSFPGGRHRFYGSPRIPHS